MADMIDDYFTKTLIQLMHDPDDGITTSAIALALEFPFYELRNLTLAEILEHEDERVRLASARELLRDVWACARRREHPQKSPETRSNGAKRGDY